MSKTAEGLVEYAKAQLGRPYWFGTFGTIANVSLWTSKSKQYPQYYTEARKTKAKEHYGKKVHDCAGLIKGYLWSESADAPAKYNAKQDLSADAMYQTAKQKGTIATIPERPGLAVWRKGHIGVYIGGGKVIEAKGFDFGVIKSNLKGSTFTHWLEVPNIDYSSITHQVQERPKTEAKPEPTAPTVADSSSYIVQKGDTLSAIAKKYGTTVQAIASANNITNVNLIRVGQKLTIPGKNKAPAKPVSATYIVTTNGGTLRIRKGPGTNYAEIGSFINRSIIEVSSISNGWAKLANRDGYVSASWITKK